MRTPVMLLRHGPMRDVSMRAGFNLCIFALVTHNPHGESQ